MSVPTTAPPVDQQVETYLSGTEDRYPPGTAESFAREALAAALASYRAGNYGIGAVAVVRTGNDISEFRTGNAMVSPTTGIVDHAETRALLRILNDETPDATYTVDVAPDCPEGISVYGTLEACPMCASVITNAGAVLSVSTVPDGVLVTDSDGYRASNGAANVDGDKYPTTPSVWRQIQQSRGLTFDQLQTTDQELKDLSSLIFTSTRAEIDAILASRPPIGHKGAVTSDAIRAGYSARPV